jgi:hypothetical protein
MAPGARAWSWRGCIRVEDAGQQASACQYQQLPCPTRHLLREERTPFRILVSPGISAENLGLNSSKSLLFPRHLWVTVDPGLRRRRRLGGRLGGPGLRVGGLFRVRVVFNDTQTHWQATEGPRAPSAAAVKLVEQSRPTLLVLAVSG